MSSKKHGLGRGLDALLIGARNNSENNSVEASTSVLNNNSTSDQENFSGLLELALNTVQPGPYQPRQKFPQEELERLADSIKVQGILQPIVVRPLENNKYEIIAGERRYRAAKIAGLEKVPAVIKKVEKEAAMAMALIENIQREDLNPLEEAMALDKLSKELKWTHIQVAEAIGKSRVSVTNSLRLLSLCEEVKTLLDNGKIEVGHAKVLLGLRGDEQITVANSIASKGLSVRETERIVAKILNNDEEESMPKRHSMDPDVKRLQEELAEKLCARVEIQHGPQGKGKLVVQYNSVEELEGILEHIK